MDNNLVFVFLILIIIGLVIAAIDEAILLFIMGFAIVIFAMNLEVAFSITSSSYSGSGKLFFISYASLAVFAFGKAALTGYTGYSILKGKK